VPKTRSRALLLLCLPLMLSACRVGSVPRPEAASPDSAARVDITRTMAGYERALLARNTQAAASYFMPDARLLEQGADDVVGVRAIRSAMDDFFSAGGVVTGLSLESEDIHVDGRIAFELGSFERRFRMGNSAEETIRGRYMIRWERGPEARWRIARFLLNHYPSDSASATAAR
jgi:ketosteroid isomerase-like protein